MFIAKVIGNVVATQKDETLVGSKLLIIQPLELLPGQKTGGPIIAVDAIGAGAGETVLVATGSSARNATKAHTVADAAVVGIVDAMELHQG
ncbi:MAG: EutN/CcmL family microcompartment protein [Bacillota bacterium]|jgi:ethanolamine utilization protein EutN|uniref:Ethanolamine utilization protein EutN n=1 Tax=Thermanaerosceptrum fracticalcis TaxID=1712410 RepID=A0A7G6E7F6_THEFR|nr:EutN/CcmL family microcompartment protein [Thermanaerosceptrum fracticalcis]QNB48010.1 ethanolamine utilization protein EutN [Thermanaerosceptrum fracticalcis]